MKIVVESMDRNQDGFIDKGELSAYILLSIKVGNKRDSKEIFKSADKNKDGAVTWLEHKRNEFEFDEKNYSQDSIGEIT